MKVFNTVFLKLILISIVISISSNQINATDLATEILKGIYLDNGFAAGSYVVEMQVKNTQSDGESDTANIRVYLLLEGEEEKSIVSFLSPENLQDDLYLAIGNNTWIYKYGLKRPIRISPQQKLFGDAGIAETVGIDYYHNYQVDKLEGDEDFYYLEVSAKESENAYQRARLTVSKGDKQLQKVVLLALNGQALKELIFSEYRNLDGHLLSKISIQNLLYEKERVTELEYLTVQSRELPAQAFQPLMLDKFKLLVRE